MKNINELPIFISKTFFLKSNPEIYEVDLSNPFLQGINTNKFPCFLTFHDKNPIIYNNSTLYITNNFEKNKDRFLKLFHKSKIFPFSKSDRENLISISTTLDVIDEDEILFLQSLFDKYKYTILFCNHKKPLYNRISKLILISIIYESANSDRSLKISQFQTIYDSFNARQGDKVLHNSDFGYIYSYMNYAKKNSFLFITKIFSDKYQHFYKNEKKIVQYLNKFRDMKYQIFKFYKKINYDSNFPIISSFPDRKDNQFICEFISDENLSKRYSKKTNLIEKLIIIISLTRSINLIHSFGFVYRDWSITNIFFKNYKSKIPILFNLSAVMPMKMESEKDPNYECNENESNNIGPSLFFSPEKNSSPKESLVFSFPSDIFSFGLLIHYFILGKYATKSNYMQCILDEINKADFLPLKEEFNKEKMKSELINDDLLNLQDDDIDALDYIYTNCIKYQPRERLTIREIGFKFIEFVQKILQKDHIQQNFDKNDLTDLKNCMLGLIDDLSSPIPFIIGLSDSYYAYSTTNELENFYFFLIDNELIFDSALSYISQIKPVNFGTFHFDKIDSNINSLTLCIEKYAIIVKNTGSLIHDFIHKLYSTLKQIKLIPSSKDDNFILMNGGFLDKSENELLLIEWQIIQELIEQIEKVVLPQIERKSFDIREPKAYSLIPLISYLILCHYFDPSNNKEIFGNNFIDFKLNNQKLLLDLESFSLIIKEETKINMYTLSAPLLQEILRNDSDQTLYRYYPYIKNQEKLSMMTEENKLILVYGIASSLNFIQANNFYLKSLTFSDLYIYPNKNIIDFNIRILDNLVAFGEDDENHKNFDLLKEFIEKINLPKLTEFIQEFGCNQKFSFEFINNYLYIKYISLSCYSIKQNIPNLLKLSFNSLPSKFNGNDLFPTQSLDHYSTNIFNFDFYNISNIDVKDIITQTQKLPFITYEYIDDDKYFVFCIENKCFFLKDCQKDKISNIFDLLLQINPNLTVIPIKESDKEKLQDKKIQRNFFNRINQLYIQERIEKIKQKIIVELKEKNRFIAYSNYFQFTNAFLNEFFMILSPVIGYSFFRHYFPTNSFKDNSFFQFYKENKTSLVDFSNDRESMIDIINVENGSTALIYLTCHLPSLYPLVVKEYKSCMFEYFYIEKEFGEEIKRKNIENSLANFYGFIDKKDKKSIIMKFYPNGSLNDFNFVSKFSENERKKMFENIMCNGIDVLKELRYIHNDIKPSNILLDNNFNPIIIDFNCSYKMKDNEYYDNKEDIDSLTSVIPSTYI